MKRKGRISPPWMRSVVWVAASVLCAAATMPVSAASPFAAAIADVQPKIAKIYGAGGLRGMEYYQSGLLISPDGHILTVASYVLDTEDLTVVLDDGRRFRADVLGSDPRLEIAMLKIPASDLRCFQLSAAVELEVGDRVLAFSNLYGVATGDEDASVLHGHVAARTSLAGRRGVYRTPYRGTAYILDAMTNNPGSAGGALTDRRGRLAGMLGKELRNVQDNTWLNYALPVGELSAAVADLIAGKARPRDPSDTSRKPREPATLASLGIVLVPDVLSKTPPFVDRVISGSAADKAGVRPDDLVLLVNDHTVTSVKAMVDELSFIDRIDEVRLVLQRDQELLQVSLFATGR